MPSSRGQGYSTSLSLPAHELELTQSTKNSHGPCIYKASTKQHNVCHERVQSMTFSTKQMCVGAMAHGDGSSPTQAPQIFKLYMHNERKEIDCVMEN